MMVMKVRLSTACSHSLTLTMPDSSAEFENIAEDFTKPTKEDLVNFSLQSHNVESGVFLSIFNQLGVMMMESDEEISNGDSYSSKDIMMSLVNILTVNVNGPYRLSVLNSISFFIF